jgi:hypothetical protein
MMLQRALLLACLIAMAQAQVKHIKYYNPSDECKNEMCWQCVCPFICSSALMPSHAFTSRYLIPFWLVAILLIVVAVCCKMMYAM